MKNLDKDALIKMIHDQAKNADMWITQWERYKDVSGIRNASLAIGKLFGVYGVLIQSCDDDEDAPVEIIKLTQKYSAIWDGLHISKNIAQAISIHG